MVLAVAALNAVAALLNWALAAAVHSLGRGSRWAKPLAALLVLEGFFQLAIAAISYGDPAERYGAGIGFPLAISVLPWVYLLFLGAVDTRLTAPLRKARARQVLAAGAVVFGLVGAGFGIVSLVLGERFPESAFFLIGAFLLLYVSVLLFGLVAALVALRNSPRGTATHDRAVAFAWAFGLRDVLSIFGITASFFTPPERPDGVLTFFDAPELLTAVGAILFALLLTYGILRTQLFDLDLRVKVGISRTTVISIILVAVFVVAKIAENYLSRTVGFVAGSIVAGSMLFLVPRLNKIGDKVANSALPAVQPTPVYLAFKKLEVYRSAVEAAHETGGVTDKERATLDRLRDKLQLTSQDAAAVEQEVASLTRPAPFSS